MHLRVVRGKDKEQGGFCPAPPGLFFPLAHICGDLTVSPLYHSAPWWAPRRNQNLQVTFVHVSQPGATSGGREAPAPAGPRLQLGLSGKGAATGGGETWRRQCFPKESGVNNLENAGCSYLMTRAQALSTTGFSPPLKSDTTVGVSGTLMGRQSSWGRTAPPVSPHKRPSFSPYWKEQLGS